MSLALAMSSGAMGTQAQTSYTTSMGTVFGIMGIVLAATAVGYGVIYITESKPPMKGGRQTRKRRT